MMRKTDEVAKCMWFLADTGWTVRDDDPYIEFQGPNGSIGVFAVCESNPFIYCDGKSRYVEDLFTAVVVAYAASNDPTVPNRVKWTNNDNPVHGEVTGASVTMRCGLSFMASRLIPALNQVASETALIVRLDVRETSGGHVWTIYWQEPDDGEA